MVLFVELFVILLVIAATVPLYLFINYLLSGIGSTTAADLKRSVEKAEKMAEAKRKENEELARELAEANKELDELTSGRPRRPTRTSGR